MNEEKTGKISSLRASLGNFSSFSQNLDADDVDDPINAYFNKRSESFSKIFSEKPSVSGSGSSLGLIDVENISLFDVDEEDERKSFRFSDKGNQITINSPSLESTEKKLKTGPVVPEPELELYKQRALAQKALKRLSSNSSGDLDQELHEKKENATLHDIPSKLMNVKLSDAAEIKKNWLEPNVSPYTPRYFNDELSSFGGENETLLNHQTEQFEQKENSNKRESMYIKKINSMLKEVPNNIKGSELEFKTQTKEEQINQLEEDEKKFKFEGYDVLHNSKISEFSGTAGDACQWLSDDINAEIESRLKNLSIGEFFTARSNRISSLVGSISRENSMPNLREEFETSPTSSENQQTHLVSKNEHSVSITHTPAPEKPKFRRCVSTYDLKGNSEVFKKNLRYSSDSCSSNSTTLIQDILAEMESGLSGTQIYEKLIKSFGRRENELKEHKKREEQKKISGNTDTPKTSKVPREKTSSKYSKTDFSFNRSQKERKNFGSQNSVLCSNKELKENEPVLNKSLNKAVFLPKKEKTRKAKVKQGFCASTPKTQASKSKDDKIKIDDDLTLTNCKDWEPPRVHSIQSIDLSKSQASEENDRTITVSSTLTSSEFNKKNNSLAINDTITIEDTIVAGDLTVLSQRIDEMKRDSVCIVRKGKSEEPALLVVIQKLASFPKGTVDCSALTPLIRDQFPELLSNFPTPSKDSLTRSIPIADEDLKDTFLSLPGSWIKLPEALGIKEKLYACADVQKIILVPVYNLSENWLLISLKSVELVHPKGKKLSGIKKNNEWCVLDFVVVSLVETIIPPDSSQSLKVAFKSKVSTKLDLTLTFNLKELLNGEVQTRSLRIAINNVHPENYINVIPNDPINFGVIADQCFDQRTVQVSFDGICDLPLTIYLEEGDCASGNFILKPLSGHHQDGEYNGNIFHHVFYEGEKRILELRVFFQPNVLLKEERSAQDFKAELVIMLGSKTETDGILKKMPIKGSVGFAKVLCNPLYNPLVFKASRKNQSLSRTYPLKNAGELPIAFSVWIANEDGDNAQEDVFVAPKTFYLSKNEESAINVTFNASAAHDCIKRYMFFKIKPNGQVIYNVELIGITSSESKSRTSSATASSKSTANSESIPVKLLTTAPSLSWTGTALEKESRQTFQIKSVSSVTISIRITFQIKDDVFKLINENGERVIKMRKVLKPDCPTTLTVAFRPDIVGAHLNNLIFESNHSAFKKMVALNGLGGMPNLCMENVKSDLNGCKILKLQHSNSSNQFENFLSFKNEGRIHGFLLIELGTKDFSLSHELTITPTSFVVGPNFSVCVKISQKLKNVEVHQLLSNKEISKIATISVVMGDEPSRRRMRQLIENGKIQSSERLERFIAPFQYEPPKVKNFKDCMNFETEFLKSLKVFEVAIVIEKSTDVLEPSILEETVDEFVTFMSTNDNTVISTGLSQKSKETESNSDQRMSTCGNPIDFYESLFPAESKSKSSKVTEWLETFDCL